jgi:putative redox protein
MHGAELWQHGAEKAKVPHMNETAIAHTVVDSATGYAQEIRAGRHRLTSDEPIAAGGTDTGASPYALVLSGLGSCTSITLRMYAERKGWELGNVHVDLRLFRDHESGAVRITRTIQVSGALSEEQRARLAEIAEKTPVTKTLRAGATIETKLG